MKNKIVKIPQSPTKNTSFINDELFNTEKRENRTDLYDSLASFGPRSKIIESK